MIIIGEILVAEDILESHFQCDLNACKGACCFEGDYGAPLQKEEIDLFHNPPEKLLDLLNESSKEKIIKEGGSKYFKEDKKIGANLMDDGACVFLKNDNGISYCAVEMAYKNDLIDFNKPLSCHLYPIRVEVNEQTNFKSLNYDRWDICNPACKNGKTNNVTIFEFCKQGIIRAFGDEFFDALKNAATMLKNKKNK